MSWLFSRALVEEFSVATCSAGEPSAQLSVMPTQHKFWRNDKTMEHSQLSRFGLTCAVLTESHGKDLLTWFLADSRVRTYQLLGAAQELTEIAQDYGEKWRESSVMYDLNSYSWKTHQCLWEEDLPWCSVILPKWGMTRNGAVYQHPTSERFISAIEYGLWPTPTATDYKGSPKGETLYRRMKDSVRGVRLPEELSRRGEVGHLNPMWVEWLMGWPLGWTDLKPLEMARFHEWQQQHSEF